MDDAAAVTARLETTFAEIYRTRMHDVPIVNGRLTVKAVGFRTHGADWIGILITPWFMNIVLLPGDGREISGQVGDTKSHILPAGRFDFMVSEEAGLGRFLMCSLFSPVLEFSDQKAAEITANAALGAVLQQDETPSAPAPDSMMYSLARGQGPMADMTRHLGAQKAKGPVSRRRLLVPRDEKEGTEA